MLLQCAVAVRGIVLLQCAVAVCCGVLLKCDVVCVEECS